MRILLDENVSIDILPVLKSSGQEAQSVNFAGPKGFHNGDLIERARQQFDLLLTRDKDFTSVGGLRVKFLSLATLRQLVAD